MVDRRESIAIPLVSLEAMLDGRQATIQTAMPGILESYDASSQTASVQTAIQAQVRDATGVWTFVDITVLVDCPVQFPRGGGYGFTFPLVKGNEGIVIFSSRCIDAWWQSGGVQPQAELRMHDLSDGMFVPGISSKPSVPAGVSTDSARFWAEDGSMFVDLNKETETIRIKAVNIFLDGTVIMNNVSGESGGSGGVVDFGGATVRQGGKNIGATHTHGGVTTGGGTSGPVT